jgi:hypothetical protein
MFSAAKKSHHVPHQLNLSGFTTKYIFDDVTATPLIYTNKDEGSTLVPKRTLTELKPLFHIIKRGYTHSYPAIVTVSEGMAVMEPLISQSMFENGGSDEYIDSVDDTSIEEQVCQEKGTSAGGNVRVYK